MKDKAEVLVEVERLRAVQAELNAELASLHTDLEKERSKNADPRAKDKVGFFYKYFINLLYWQIYSTVDKSWPPWR